MNKSLLSLTIAAAIALTGCEKKPVETTPPDTSKTHNEVHFNFDNHFGSEELTLGSGTYTTAQNEQVTINTFNYWITNIELINSDGTTFKEAESYRLLRGDKSATHHFHIADVPKGSYTGIKFIVGVDLDRNTSGAQTGDLDPAVCGDMYWSWATGYIQAKLEGTSPQSTSPNKSFSYHIAGIQPGFETPRTVTINFPQTMVVGDKAGSIKITTDAAKFFGPATPLTIASTPSSLHGGELASKIANNFTAMFTVTSAGNE